MDQIWEASKVKTLVVKDTLDLKHIQTHVKKAELSLVTMHRDNPVFLNATNGGPSLLYHVTAGIDKNA